MAAKPYTAGHNRLIEDAVAVEGCDHTYVIVSLSDREEMTGAMMRQMWEETIEELHPASHVSFLYTGGGRNVDMATWASEIGIDMAGLAGAVPPAEKGDLQTWSKGATSPIMAVLNIMGLAELAAEYLSPERSMRALPSRDISKLYPEREADYLAAAGVSGTKMRDYLVKGDRTSFTQHIPTRFRSWRHPQTGRDYYDTLQYMLTHPDEYPPEAKVKGERPTKIQRQTPARPKKQDRRWQFVIMTGADDAGRYAGIDAKYPYINVRVAAIARG